MISIGNLNLDSNIFLAPMAGVTDQPFRIICREYGAGLVFTEFVSSNGIIRENEKTLNMIRFKETERPIGVQIFGECPDIVGQSAKYIEKEFSPDIIDINFGCPVPKVTKKGAGSGAMKNLNLMGDITTSVINSVSNTPITVKMRAGWSDAQLVYVEAGKILESIGVSAITLHARTTKQQFTGQANWDYIKELKENVNIPIIGNGDIATYSDYQSIISHTKCDGIMIGRAALGNPWVFSQIHNKENSTQSKKAIIGMCVKHLALLKDYYNEKVTLNLSKKHFSWYLKGFDGASALRKTIMKCDDLSQIDVEINHFLNDL